MRLERITGNGAGTTRSANSSPGRRPIRALEAVWSVLVVVFGLYKALGLFVPLPTPATEFSLPILIGRLG
jgi:hypothetical protein